MLKRLGVDKMITIVLVVSLILTAMVLVLSLIAINRGYAYKHTVDPLEEDHRQENKHN